MIVTYQSNSFWAYFVCSYTFGKRSCHVKDVEWLQKYQEDPTSRLQSWVGVPCLIWRTKVDTLTPIFYFLHTHFERLGFLFCIGNIRQLLSSLSLTSKSLFSGQTPSDFESIPCFFSQSWCWDNDAQLMRTKEGISISLSSKHDRTRNSSEQIPLPSEAPLFRSPFSTEVD